MLRGLLRDSESAKALLEKMDLFKAPELLEKYVVASEVTVEVLDLFFSHIFGTERASIARDLKGLWESLGGASLNDKKASASDDLSAHGEEPNKDVEGLRVKVQDLERQLCAVQRQLQMQGEVSQLAVSLDGRLDEIARECERQVSDVRSEVSAVSEDVVRLTKDVRERANCSDVKGLREEVLRLKESECSLGSRISGVEKTAEEAERALSEIQGVIKRLYEVVKLNPSDPLNGIIAKLTRECGGNVHEKQAVGVTASSVETSNTVAKNAVDLGTDPFFASDDKPNSWICYDFKGRRLAPTSYSIRTHTGWYPRSWVLEVSNDGSDGSWEIVDRRDDNKELNSGHVTRNFTISDPPSGSFRFVRLRQTGKNSRGYQQLVVSSLEVFGILSSQ